VKSLMFGYDHFVMRLAAQVARFARTRVIVEQHGVLGTEVCVVTGGRSQEIVDLGLRLSALLGVNPGIPVFEGVPVLMMRKLVGSSRACKVSPEM